MTVLFSFKRNTKIAKHFKVVMLILFFLENKIFWRKSNITALGTAVFFCNRKDTVSSTADSLYPYLNMHLMCIIG